MPSMTFADLREEVLQRGFTYLQDNTISQARRDRWINQGMTDLNDEEPWPWLEATQTGNAPLTISDLREIIYVATSTGLLEARDVRDLVDGYDPLLATTGTPKFYWRDGMTQIKVYPVAVTSLTVRYIKVAPDLSAATDVPIIPPRYHNLIVDYAVMRALRDRSNFVEAGAVREALLEDLNRVKDSIQANLDRMRGTLIRPTYQRLTDTTAA